MKTFSKNIFFVPLLLIALSITILAVAAPANTSAAENVASDLIFNSAPTTYVPLAAIPGTTNEAGETNLSLYLTGMFKFGVAAAGVLAFITIVWGGFTYLSTDSIMGKEEGKYYIQRALGGLVLALASYIILNTINSKLVDLDLYFGEPVEQKDRGGPPKDFNQQLTDQQLAMLKTRSIERDNAMSTQVTAKKDEASALRETASQLPDGAEKTALLEKAAQLEGEASEIDLQRVAEGEERQASLNTLNAYTPEQLATAITEAGQSIEKIQVAYTKARTDFASDPARVAELSIQEMEKISVIRKSTAFGIIENPPNDPDSAMVVDNDALVAQIGEQMAKILGEQRTQISHLSTLNATTDGGVRNLIDIKNNQVREIAKQQICDIKNFCNQKGVEFEGCLALYPEIQCVY
ncbi:MAG: hypothetical protein NUV54_01745 [Candidatus Taylorbacteria bacterium]|nr:hypothetical protein [Candidatus Taylorbacteria bacterium]